MIGKHMKVKRKLKHRQYQKSALLKNIKKVVDYCLWDKSMAVFYEYSPLYLPYCKRWNVSLSSYEQKLMKRLR